jgi:hypothetical protein
MTICTLILSQCGKNKTKKITPIFVKIMIFFSNDKNPTKEYTNNILIGYQKDQCVIKSTKDLHQQKS